MENPIQLNIPVSLSYAALEGLLQQQLVGSLIPRPEAGTTESPYAQVLDVGIAGSSAGAYNLLLRVQLRILRTVLKRDQVDLYASVALDYDNARQELYVSQFYMEAATPSRLYNKSLEVLVNKVAYNQIIKKTRVDLRAVIAAEVEKINSQLAEGLELKGLKLTGAVAAVGVQDLVPEPGRLSLRLQVQAQLEVAVFDLSELLPPQVGKGIGL